MAPGDEAGGVGRGSLDESRLADASLSGDQEKAGARLEVSSYGGQLGAPACDPGFMPGGSASRCGRVEPELTKRSGVTLQCLNKKLESAPRWETRRGEHLRDGRVGDPGLTSKGTQGRPSCSVVKVVERFDQITLWADGQAGTRKRAQSTSDRPGRRAPEPSPRILYSRRGCPSMTSGPRHPDPEGAVDIASARRDLASLPGTPMRTEPAGRHPGGCERDA